MGKHGPNLAGGYTSPLRRKDSDHSMIFGDLSSKLLSIKERLPESIQLSTTRNHEA